MDKPLTRRTLLSGAASLAAAPAILAQRNPNDRIGIAMVGVGTRGSYLLERAQEAPNTEIRVICDLYDSNLKRAANKAFNKKAQLTKEWEKAVASPDVDAVFIATPDFWHAPMAIRAAGNKKHVYVEKALCRTLDEAKGIRKAVKDNNVVLQLGHHQNSDPYFIKAKEIFRSGQLGKTVLARTYIDRTNAWPEWQFYTAYDIQQRPADASPETIDWTRFLANAPATPFDAERFFRWRCWWDYGTGIAGDLMSHQWDGVNMIVGMGIPEAVQTMGGLYFWKQDREVPDQWHVMLEYPKQELNVAFACSFHNNHHGTNTYIFGRDATLEVHTDWCKLYGAEWKPENAKRANEARRAGQPVQPDYAMKRGELEVSSHMRNFIDCIRSGETPRCGIDRAWEEAVTVVMSVEAYRKERKVRWDPRTEQIRMTAAEIVDLRSALAFLATVPGQLVTTREPVDPNAELAGVYRHIGAGTPVAPPTRIGPAMLFQNVKGYTMPVVTGVLASRLRTALLLGSTIERLPFELLAALEHPLAPVTVPAAGAPCQEVVLRPPFDLRSLIPAPTNTLRDAGPYFNMGLLRAEDPETGESDVTIHRLCIQGPDRLSVYFVPGRHIDQFRIKAEKNGGALPVSISMGLDPAIYLAACFEPPTTPLGFDELTIAGGLRRRPVELVQCVSVAAKAIARAEIVIEGEILPGERIREDAQTNTGYCMPEFPGYLGKAQPQLPIVKVTAVTHRRDPILQTIVGPGEEHVNLTGIPTEASILRLVENSMPGRLRNVYCHSAGGGKYLAILQFCKAAASDEGRQRQAALTAFAAFSELKHVVLVDEDVNIYDSNDVLWAMTTRYQGDVSTVFIPGVRCHPLDPSQSPEFSSSIPAPGISCKTIFDCTVPYAMKDQFRRAEFLDVDPARFLPE